jgi:hypothetical protein
MFIFLAILFLKIKNFLAWAAASVIAGFKPGFFENFISHEIK